MLDDERLCIGRWLERGIPLANNGLMLISTRNPYLEQRIISDGKILRSADFPMLEAVRGLASIVGT